MGPEISYAIKNMFAYLTVQEIKPKMHWIDNKALALLITSNQ